MKKISPFVIAWLLFCAGTTYAETVTVGGQVYLDDQSEPDSVKVVIERVAPSALKDSTYTDNSGSYQHNIETGIYTVTFSKDGYFPFSLHEQAFYADTSLDTVTLLKESSFLNVPADFPSIQNAIDSSSDGDTVLVAPGTYYENINFNGKNITVASNFLTTNDTTYISQTVIDGNHNGHVVEFSSGESSNAVLTGFTITNGYKTGDSNDYGAMGGGIVCDGSSPTIKNVIVTNNEATFGGGLHCIDSEATLCNVYFLSNTASIAGGGISLVDLCDVHISDVIVKNNSTISGGGGILVSKPSFLTMQNADIIGNKAVYGGGGIHSYAGDPNGLVISNSRIIGNISDSNQGGGICCKGGNLTNVLIEFNKAKNGGGIFYYNPYAELSLANVTVVNNSANEKGSGFYQKLSSSTKLETTIRNCIFVNNSGSICFYFDPGSNPSITYSNIFGNESGNFYNAGDWVGKNVTTNANGDSCDAYNNIKLDPLFVDPDNGDYHLLDTSPCIGAGTSENAPEYDMDGNPRKTPPDIGAYEFTDPVIVQERDILPSAVTLHYNYPNPFNPTTTISYSIPSDSRVRLTVYNSNGQCIQILEDEFRQAGRHTVTWNAAGQSSGLYFCMLRANGRSATQKMMYVK